MTVLLFGSTIQARNSSCPPERECVDCSVVLEGQQRQARGMDVNENPSIWPTVVPAAAALAGVALTYLGQWILHLSNRRHAAAAKLAAELRSAYSRFVLHAREAVISARRWSWAYTRRHSPTASLDQEQHTQLDDNIAVHGQALTDAQEQMRAACVQLVFFERNCKMRDEADAFDHELRDLIGRFMIEDGDVGSRLNRLTENLKETEKKLDYFTKQLADDRRLKASLPSHAS